MTVISLVVYESNLSYGETITKNMMHSKLINIKKSVHWIQKNV